MAIKLIKRNKTIKRDNLPLVIGYFGCIHVMHQQLLTRFHEFNVLTFTDLGIKRAHQIYNYKTRLENLQKFGPKNIYVLDVSTINMTGKHFINDILKPLDPSCILVGEDFKFGSDNLRVKDLRDHFKVYDLRYNPNISTKKIYDLLIQGKVEEANDYMSFYLYYKSKWIGGLRRGSKIGYPTINMRNTRPFMLPEGSYATMITLGVKRYPGVTFVGQSKTIKHPYPVVETHVFDQRIKSKLFYPHWVKDNVIVEFFKFLRPNTKMANLEQLKEAIAKDILKAKKYFREQNYFK